MKLAYTTLFAGLATAPWLAAQPALAADITVQIDIPRLDVAEYHRPYIAIWIENEDHSAAKDLAVLYDTDLPDQEGEKWLKDMRQWWRRSGRGLDMPVDGVSRPTLPPGQHELTFSTEDALADLPPGEYGLVVEAAREVGGRELLSIPFTWPPAAAGNGSAAGSSELGEVRIDWTP